MVWKSWFSVKQLIWTDYSQLNYPVHREKPPKSPNRENYVLSKPRPWKNAQRCLALSCDYFHRSRQGRRSGAQARQDGPGASAESPTALEQPVPDLKVCSRKGAWLWPMSCPTQQPGKGGASNTGPRSTYAPSPEQLATILGSLICCDLSSQNICLKKDQIFIAHLRILLKGEMRLVMVDKCQSMCEERTREEKKGRERKVEKERFLTCSIYTFLLLLSSFLCSVFWCWESGDYNHAIQSSPVNPVLSLDVIGLCFVNFVDF